MNTKNTASQPKLASITNDGKFHHLATKWAKEWNLSGKDCKSLWGDLCKYIETRAPADQAASVADDDALFERWVRHHLAMPEDSKFISTSDWAVAAREGWIGHKYAAPQQSLPPDVKAKELAEALTIEYSPISVTWDALIWAVKTLVKSLSDRAAEGQVSAAAPADSIGEVTAMPGTSGFTMAVFKAADVPVGTKLFRASEGQAKTSAAMSLAEDDVEWVVNSFAELGVKVGNQFFFLYKGSSIVYNKEPDEREKPLMWRHVFKREFGECAHPINHNDYSKIGTVSLGDSEDWKPVPAAQSADKSGEQK